MVPCNAILKAPRGLVCNCRSAARYDAPNTVIASIAIHKVDAPGVALFCLAGMTPELSPAVGRGKDALDHISEVAISFL